MRTVRFTFDNPVTYEGVPIPDDLEEQEIFNYLTEHFP